MRSFFNKPSWASRGDETGNSDFYRRAGQTYKDIIATNQSARERRVSSSLTGPRKRRRVSSSSEGGSQASDTGGGEVAGQSTPLANPPSPPGDPQCGATLDRCPRTRQVSDLDDNASPGKGKDPTSPPPRASPKNESHGQSSRTCATSLPADTIGKRNADNHTISYSENARASIEIDTSRDLRTSAFDNAVVQILITSKIENTKPLIIHRKMSQSLKGVRLAWCTHQNLPKELYSAVFLTWKGRRLFDVTTCRSLNIKAHSKDLSSFDETFGDDTFSDMHGTRIHMEAVTEEIFAAGYRSSPKMLGFDSTATPSTEPQVSDQHTRSEIVLKCPGLDDFQLRVTAKTRISQVVAAFREARGVSPESDVYLAFDGDRLDPGSFLADYEIGDGDLVDVLVKKPM
ncbi:small ubiquitin-related modifier domain-containing protein [Aspergillus lucknowensis]|uniref:Ubiquitin-2 like Rad60 SUMO-like-domain-containing protein n=1 Tax=Aspergillus lucknowensis TaxID=176173 RepID=A0ABR4LK96_9EURO